LNVTVPVDLAQRRVADPALAVNASVSRVHYTTIREETPMKNGSETCLTTFGRKTQLVDRTAPAAALLSLETTPLPVYGTAGQQFHATVPMISSANDIDILNIMPTGPSTFLPNN
jgi:hypothetical protein